MDDEHYQRIGLDLNRNTCRTVTINMSETGPTVVSALSRSVDDLLKSDELKTTPYVVSIPDEEVMVKEITISMPDTSKLEEQLKFEISNSLLDEPAEFCFDTVTAGDGLRHIISVVRKNRLKNLFTTLRKNKTEMTPPDGFMMRAMALGRGYLRYYEQRMSGLICLADFSSKRASLCFVLDKEIVALAHFDWRRLIRNETNDIDRISAELKTIINFKLNTLTEKKIASSLSSLIIFGHDFEGHQKDSLRKQLAVELTKPRINQTLVDELQSVDSICDYIIPLGLTVE